MTTPYQDHQNPEVVPDLRREWMILARHRQLIVIITLAATVAAALYNYGVRPLYESVAILSINQTVPNQPLARLTLTAQRLNEVIEKEITRMTGVDFASALTVQLEPRETRELATGPLGPWFKRLRLPGADEARVAPAALNKAEGAEALLSRLALQSRAGSTWVEVRMLGYDPEAVAGLANEVVRSYLSVTESANRQAIEASQTALEQQLETKEKKLGEELSGLREQQSDAGVGDVAARRAILERQVRAFQETLVAAQTARVGRAATSREAAKLGGGVLAQSADPRIQAAQDRVSTLEDREKELLATLGARHPEVVTLQEQLKTARERLASVVASAQQAADSAYELALNEETRIEASLQRAQKELASLDNQSLSYSLGQKKAEASRLALEQLIQRQQNATPTIIDVEVIQPASPASSPVSPQKGHNLLYGLVGGLLAGVLLAWARERFDDTIQSPEDVRGVAGLPFLGVIPLIPRLPSTSLTLAITDNRTGFSDGLRVVRTNLMYGAPQLKPRVLVFTSASPGDGKSTVALGVTLLLHETQARVLLIDGDLRRPSVHTLLGLPETDGLSTLLAGPAPVRLAVANGPLPGIDVLTAGPPLTVSAARLGSENMKSLIAQARESYDWIIIDSPPSLGLPDASVLATLADGVVIVCSGDKTPRQALGAVTEQLRSVGASVLGVVLNRVNMDRHSYYYGRYYSTYYGTDAKAAPSSEPPASPAA
jgi:capsular exopolysaccharide synthesis family protein